MIFPAGWSGRRSGYTRMESHCGRDGTSGTGNCICEGRDLTEAEPGNRAGNADSAYRRASGIEYWGADAAGARHCFLIVERVALPLDFLKFPA